MNTKQASSSDWRFRKYGFCLLQKTFLKATTGYSFTASNTNKVQSLIYEIKAGNSFADIEIVDDYVQACWEADIIIAAVPLRQKKK